MYNFDLTNFVHALKVCVTTQQIKIKNKTNKNAHSTAFRIRHVSLQLQKKTDVYINVSFKIFVPLRQTPCHLIHFAFF